MHVSTEHYTGVAPRPKMGWTMCEQWNQRSTLGKNEITMSAKGVTDSLTQGIVPGCYDCDGKYEEIKTGQKLDNGKNYRACSHRGHPSTFTGHERVSNKTYVLQVFVKERSKLCRATNAYHML